MNKDNLWNEVINGSTAAIEKIYQQYAEILYRYGLKFTSQEQIIEDSIQELFSSLIKYHKNLSPTDNLKIYLLKSFKNKLLRALKKENKYINGAHEDYDFEVEFKFENEIVQNDEEVRLKKILEKAIIRLSSRQKEVIYLRYTKQLEYEEICEIMEMEIESCRNLLYRAIKSLRISMKNTNFVLFYFF